MRPLFHVVARQKSSELFVLFVLLVTLGLAWVTELAGLSLALGAFLAGMLISETEYRYQVDDYIKPFRDVLLGFFFVTIGMLLDPRVLLAHWFLVALVLVALLAREVRARLLAGARLRQREADGAALRAGPRARRRIRLRAAFARAAARARSAPPTLQVVLAGALLSMLATPVLLANSERIVLYFVESEWTQRAMALHQLAVKTMATQGPRHRVRLRAQRAGAGALPRARGRVGDRAGRRSASACARPRRRAIRSSSATPRAARCWRRPRFRARSRWW